MRLPSWNLPIGCVMICSVRFMEDIITGKRDRQMGDITSIILVAIMVVLGGIPSLYILISMPIILAGKIYRKVKFGNSLYD